MGKLFPFLGFDFLIYEMGFKGALSPFLSSHVALAHQPSSLTPTRPGNLGPPAPNPLTPAFNNQLEKGTSYPGGGCGRCYPLPKDLVCMPALPLTSCVALRR